MGLNRKAGAFQSSGPTSTPQMQLVLCCLQGPRRWQDPGHQAGTGGRGRPAGSPAGGRLKGAEDPPRAASRRLPAEAPGLLSAPGRGRGAEPPGETGVGAGLQGGAAAGRL